MARLFDADDIMDDTMHFAKRLTFEPQVKEGVTTPFETYLYLRHTPAGKQASRLLAGARNIFNAESFGCGEIPFASKPVFHRGGEAIERDAQSGLEEAVGDGESVVEDGVVGEIAHREVVDPGDGAGISCTIRGDAVDAEFAKPHEHSVPGAGCSVQL